ncbi:RsmB/NOP family class I SAM-dependent RNA methyltransferase [Buchananella hordeovulneris]|uniref:SAM-dependent MTase RsmB/NOP-type domain-containing protein n=1 Tax=Buchananella hordeovulneris TaxID=52770 RepID=A0A1Q5PY93_9ACTO|nr:transcription antitermination factor NusB [Buchananella hordeovulneris]OKL52419.1 hypothetical protein BSZ40_02800 [Buchananella hordeovulneris]
MSYVKKRHSVDPARAAALDVLQAVSTQDAYANIELPKLLRQRRLRPLDAAFATELTYGTLRMQGKYDALIACSATRPLDQLDPLVANLLRLGAHQLLTLQIAPYAAVSETVALARTVTSDGPARMVNAVLRRLAEKTPEQWDEELAQQPDETARRAASTSHPEWIVRALTQALTANGRAAADIDEVLAANNAAPQLALVARPGLSEPAELAAEAAASGDAAATSGRVSPYAVLVERGDPGALAAVRSGAAAAQDEGSQLVAALLAAAPLNGPDANWLDLCAGPGGKTGLLAALAAARGAHVLANEVTEHRAELVRQTTALLDNVTVRDGDGRAVPAEFAAHFDRTLVDVPCSGLGSLRRRPEARWRRQPRDLAALAPLQRELLAAAIAATRPGGLVAYATCSPHIAETHVVINDALAGGQVELVDASAVARTVVSWIEPLACGTARGQLAGSGRATRAEQEENGQSPARQGNTIPPQVVHDFGAGPFVQLWPDLHGTDAMFVALLQVKEEV